MPDSLAYPMAWANAGIRNTGYNVRMHGIAVSLCKHASTAVAHLLYIYTFIRGCRISVVNPEERTDLHFLSRLNQSFKLRLLLRIRSLQGLALYNLRIQG